MTEINFVLLGPDHDRRKRLYPRFRRMSGEKIKALIYNIKIKLILICQKIEERKTPSYASATQNRRSFFCTIRFSYEFDLGSNLNCLVFVSNLALPSTSPLGIFVS